MGVTETALGGQGELTGIAAQEGTELGFHLAEPVEAGPIEMADAQIHGDIQKKLAITGLGQPHQAGTSETKGGGAAAVRERDGWKHSGAGVGRWSPRFERPAGVADTHHPGGLIASHNRTSTNHCAISDGDAGRQKGLGTDPGIGPNHNLARIKLEGF
jgi:hypothetical protein